MAVQAEVKSVKLQIKYLGEVVNGRQTYITKTYNRVKPNAQNQDIYDVGKIIAGLQTNPLYGISKSEDSGLSEA
ncbi:DUF1659 domain-containing protein [Lutispora thermophila]|uniref:DUF1659 domain-containing protein n=1 Tax=Lutispora thermophila DSM 19022 TaxID=1122184 RepID=A0A1M6APN1_9FIRM|nr:DUF1659 domain-containing protein [Lutispora thermophila]SHI38357.1 Protein of unknown function [Lutispora thermophila DSM 19022]